MTRSWTEHNQEHLILALAEVRGHLERYRAIMRPNSPANAPQDAKREDCYLKTLAPQRTNVDEPPALEVICRAFGLSKFERAILLLCAGVELDARFAALCSEIRGGAAGEERPTSTFGLALAALPNPHWNALSPRAALRHWRLIEVAGPSLTQSALRIDERILHFLCGVNQLDERLAGTVDLLPLSSKDELVPSQNSLAEQITALWCEAGTLETLSVVQLRGVQSQSKRQIAAEACAQMGWQLGVVSALGIPAVLSELDVWLRLWRRETVLNSCVLLLECDDLDDSDASRQLAVSHLIERLPGPLLLSTTTRRQARTRPFVTFETGKPTLEEQRTLWNAALGEAAPQLNGHLSHLSAQFDVGALTIRAASAEALSRMETGASPDLSSALWEACRVQARPRLDDLAERIEGKAGWDDLVLPEAQKRVLHDVATHVRQRATVYETWGFAARGQRGLGLSALFAGVSGTGKTMAAEVLARELKLDLYRIDLSAVVSKYIGETEKNLGRVFDAAEEGGTILLFDEADALFGKRSEVKDSHDRHANIEVGYLLQRMESYRGLAILTTNIKSALDDAFLRRIRFVVRFPFPDATQRAEIWRRAFPPATPTQGLDVHKLARLNVAGGNIRSAALNAAFLAADEGEAVQMKHLLRAAQSEYSKMEKNLVDAEVSDWI